VAGILKQSRGGVNRDLCFDSWRFPVFSAVKNDVPLQTKDEVSFSVSRQVKTPFPIF